MSKLVDLLRTPTGCYPPTKWELQAADRIEALEAALREIGNFPLANFSIAEIRSIARAALAPEQDK